MALGDVGGTVTEPVITCRTISDGWVTIEKGRALRLCGEYEVDDTFAPESRRVFGEALSNAGENGEAIPVKVRGISIFTFEGRPPEIGDSIVGANTPGRVVVNESDDPQGVGTVLKVVKAAQLVHVLL